MRVDLLGPLVVVGDDGAPIRVPGAAKERAVLAYLALRAPTVVQPGQVIDVLWGEDPPRSANKTLQNYVASLRRMLPPGSIETDGGGYRLVVTPEDVDAFRFERLLRCGADLLGQRDFRGAARYLTDGLALWRGDPLVELAGAPAGMAEALRLAELRSIGEEDLADARLGLGEHVSLVADLEKAVVAEPLRERRWAQLMLALYRAGRQAEALRAFQRLRTTLAEQLGLEPTERVRTLEAAILAQEPALSAPARDHSRMAEPVDHLPAGSVTFLFTDVEGSTRRVREIGADAYGAELMQHRARVRKVLADNGGFERGTEGDSFFVVFRSASDGLAAARGIQEALAGGPLRVRTGVHTGEPLLIDGDYVGVDVHRAARICSAAHGGQVLVSQTTADLAPADLVDLGIFRLKDLAAPEHLYQLGDAPFDPPRALRNTNLPVDPASFVGRHQELTDVSKLVRDHRLVTLTGPGGSGKTRLALQVAAELADEYPDGVWWVPLAGVSDSALVLPTVAQALGVSGELMDALAGSRLLVLVDNFEQVVDAAPGLARLLAATPGVSLLVTSRERLAVSGEQEFQVPPLNDDAARELFVTRASQVTRDFTPDENVRGICLRLDRLPLALELAATRVKMMTPQQILGRLERRLDTLSRGGRDRPGRQATMRATIEWSYDLLSSDEQRVFRSLGVFAGGFEIDAAQAVCDATLDDLQSLVDKSLIRPIGSGRLYLLETTREYALERLDRAGETDDVRQRHAEWFFGIGTYEARSLSDRLQAERSIAARLSHETDNLRAVLAWAADHDVARGIELASSLSRVWQMRGNLGELVSWYERALAGDTRLDRILRAQALYGLSSALFFTGRHDAAKRCAEDSLALFREDGSDSGEINALERLASLAWVNGDLDESIALYGSALSTCRRVADRPSHARLLNNYGIVLMDAGELARARTMVEESVAIATGCGDTAMVTSALNTLANLMLEEGDVDGAQEHYRRSLALGVDRGDLRGQEYCVAGLACAAALGGDLASAGRLWTVVERTHKELDISFVEVERSRYAAILKPYESDPAFQAGALDASDLALDDAVKNLLA